MFPMTFLRPFCMIAEPARFPSLRSNFTKGVSMPRSACFDLLQTQALSRRELLCAGGLGVLGLSLPELLAADLAGQGRGGKAKACILMFMWGGPSQLDTWDPKPDAPLEVRGQFKPIATNVPGIRISEHFPLLA